MESHSVKEVTENFQHFYLLFKSYHFESGSFNGKHLKEFNRKFLDQLAYCPNDSSKNNLNPRSFIFNEKLNEKRLSINS